MPFDDDVRDLLRDVEEGAASAAEEASKSPGTAGDSSRVDRDNAGTGHAITPAFSGDSDGSRVIESRAPADALGIPARTDRDATGRFLPGNASARRHGLFAAGIEAAVAAEKCAFLAQSLADDGGEDIPERRRSLHDYRASLHVQVRALAAALERHGQFDRRGRLRATWISKLESLIAAATRIDAALGLERREKPVGPDLHARLAEAERERQGQ